MADKLNTDLLMMARPDKRSACQRTTHPNWLAKDGSGSRHQVLRRHPKITVIENKSKNKTLTSLHEKLQMLTSKLLCKYNSTHIFFQPDFVTQSIFRIIYGDSYKCSSFYLFIF